MEKTSTPSHEPSYSEQTASIIIRPRSSEDPPHLHRIELASFQADPWPEEDFLKFDCFVALYKPLSRETGFAVTPGVIGFVISHQIFGSANADLSEREILNIAVAPQFRRHGVGRRLLAAELDRGGTHFLEVRESNAAARQLYECQGFEIVGRRKQYYDNPRETAILMRHCTLATNLPADLPGTEHH